MPTNVPTYIDTVNDSVMMLFKFSLGEVMLKIQDEKSFWGSGIELAEKATHFVRAMGLDSEKINQRLIRYYSAENIINRPDRLGKEAAYNYLHLLQLLVARRMAQGGAPLATIRVFNQAADIAELEKALQGDLAIEAKQLIEKISADQQYTEELQNKNQRQSEYREYLKVIKNLEAAWTESAAQRKAHNSYEHEKIHNSRMITQRIAGRAERYLEESTNKLDEQNKRLREIEEATKYTLELMAEAFQEFVYKSENSQKEYQMQTMSILKVMEMHLKNIDEKINTQRG